MTRTYFMRRQTYDEYEDGTIDPGCGLCFTLEKCGWYYYEPLIIAGVEYPGGSVGPFATKEEAEAHVEPR